MPVDRRIAYESLKWMDPDVFEVYVKVRDKRLTDDEEIERSKDGIEKLWLYNNFLNALDNLESLGEIEIWNDYEHDEVRFRKAGLGRLNGVQI